MIFERYMTGRGRRGYGFRAHTDTYPNTTYMSAVRESDTGATDRPVLEILTTSYGTLGAVASFHGQEGRASGYMDILFPVCKEEEDPEWEQIMDNPGRLLYLPHISKDAFVDLSNNGNNITLEEGHEYAKDIPIPEMPSTRTFHIDDDMLADLLADLWYASSVRMNNPNSPANWPSIHVQVTDLQDQQELLDAGREFYCNVVMPSLPQALRRMISVSIGAHYSDAMNSTNGGAAALIMPQFDPNQTELMPGRYLLDKGQHQALNPLGDMAMWRQFGKAILNYARTGTLPSKGPDSWLNDFFATEEIWKNTAKAGNWIYAYLLFNGHVQAEAAVEKKGDFQTDDSEKIQEVFNSDVWSAVDLELPKGLGMSEDDARNCLAWLERDMLHALIENKDILIDEQRYHELFGRAFSLQAIRDPEMKRELSDLYDQVLLRDLEKEENNSTSLFLKQIGKANLAADSESRLSQLMQSALESKTFNPSDEDIEVLSAFASTSVQNARIITEYGERLIHSGADFQRLGLLRTVQNKDWLDDAAIRKMEQQVDRFFQQDDEGKAWRESCNRYIKAAPAPESLTTDELRRRIFHSLEQYIGTNSSFIRATVSLSALQKIFDEFGGKDSEELRRSLVACVKVKEFAVTPEDQDPIHEVLVQDDDISQEMAEVLNERFEDCLPGLFATAAEGKEETKLHRDPVISKTWSDYVTSSGRDGTNAQKDLQKRMADTVGRFVSQHISEMRKRLPDVNQAFTDLGMEESSEAMNALCDCMENLDEPLSENDASLILRVLTNEHEKNAADRMAGILSQHFETHLEEIAASDNSAEDGYLNCISGKKLTAAQETLKQNILKKLRSYAEENAADMTYQVSRVMSLISEFEDNGKSGNDRFGIFSTILASRAKSLDSGEMLTQQDLEILQSSSFRNLDEESIRQLTGSLQLLFEKDLPRMMDDSSAVDIWVKCLNIRSIGPELKTRVTESVQQYVVQNAGHLYDHINQVLGVAEKFGANEAVTTSLVKTLLEAKRTNEPKDPVLSKEMLDAVTKNSRLSRVDDAFVQELNDDFHHDLLLLDRETDFANWGQLRGKMLSRIVSGFDEKAQEDYVSFISKLKQEERPKDHVGLLLPLLKVAKEMQWATKEETISKALIEYLKWLQRESLNQEEMQRLLELKRNNQLGLSETLNQIFGKVLPDILVGKESEAEPWIYARQNGVDLRSSFEEGLSQQLKRAEGDDIRNTKLFHDILDIGTKLQMHGIAAKAGIKLITKRKTQAVHHLMSSGEKEELEKTVLLSNDASVWNQYLQLLNWEPVDADNAERDARLKREAADQRKTVFPRITDEQAKALRNYSVWNKQIQEEIRNKLSLQMKSCNSLSDIIRVPETWNAHHEDMPFLKFSDLLSYLDSAELESICCAPARTMVKQTNLNQLKEQKVEDKNSWYGKMLDRLISEHIAEDCKALAEQCETPAQVQGLLNMIHDRGIVTGVQDIVNALNYVLDGIGTQDITEISKQVQSMDESKRTIVKDLLCKAVYGEPSEQWKEKWPLKSKAAEIGMACVCFLTGNAPQWEAFLKTIFQGMETGKKAYERGVHPVQTVLFASEMLKSCGMKDEADQLADQISQLGGAVYSSISGQAKKGKSMKLLQEESNPKLYQLLVTK